MAGICRTFGMPNCICQDSLRVRLSLARSISYRSFGHFLRLPANRKKQIRTSEHLRGPKETLHLRNKLLAPAQEALDKQFEETFHLTRDHALPSNSPGETHATTGTCRMDVDGTEAIYSLRSVLVAQTTTVMDRSINNCFRSEGKT